MTLITAAFTELLHVLQSRTALLCGLALFVAACDRTPRMGDVVGTYRLNRGDATDVIEIRDDSTYLHSVQSSRGDTIADSGKWTLEDTRGTWRVIFMDFLMRAPKEGQAGTLQVRGIWPATLGHDLRGRMRLTVNDDLGWYYVREDPSRSTEDAER